MSRDERRQQSCVKNVFDVQNKQGKLKTEDSTALPLAHYCKTTLEDFLAHPPQISVYIKSRHNNFTISRPLKLQYFQMFQIIVC